MDAHGATTIPEVARLTRSAGRLFVVSGPSGVGKDAVLAALLGSEPGIPRLQKCVTATTRPRAEGEVDGRDYRFLTVAEFEAGIAAGHFLEHARYNGRLYGTPRAAVEPALAAGDDVLLKIDVQGAAQVAETAPDSVRIFLAPPTWEELERRLRDRGRESDAEVERRLEIARAEMEAAASFAYVVVNGRVAAAADLLRSIILAERARVDPRGEEAGADA